MLDYPGWPADLVNSCSFQGLTRIYTPRTESQSAKANSIHCELLEATNLTFALKELKTFPIFCPTLWQHFFPFGRPRNLGTKQDQTCIFKSTKRSLRALEPRWLPSEQPSGLPGTPCISRFKTFPPYMLTNRYQVIKRSVDSPVGHHHLPHVPPVLDRQSRATP